jgi:prepilin-type N-terminal cleavage/methylation domain-containing protein
MMPIARSRAGANRRRGLTLVELIVGMALLAIIGGTLTSLLIRQQRFHRALGSVIDSRARMRDIATILPTELRSASSAGNDFLAIGLNDMQFRATIGSSVLCRYAGATVIELPPKVLASGNVLTAWINPPRPGDVIFIYDDGTERGNVDDSWLQLVVTDTASAVDDSWCPVGSFTEGADNGQRRFRLRLSGAPDPARVRIGAPIRFAREVRYSLYPTPDQSWYVGFQTCVPAMVPGVPGLCGAREVLAGPVRPAGTDTTNSGLYFLYYDQNGAAITNAADAGRIARIGIGLRTAPQSMRRSMQLGGSMAGRDSIRLTVGIRNRI